MTAAVGSDRPPRSLAALIVLGLLAVATAAGFFALGVWQLERRTWKLALIARVEARIHAAPVAAPAPADWPAIERTADEYRRVTLHGTYLAGRDTRVQGISDLGAGHWILTPLRADTGYVVLVNRGFVPDDAPAGSSYDAPPGESTVTGLLRLTEPHGRFLRANVPADDRWYSRDVAAIAATRELGPVAPYFIDVDAPPADGALPVTGLTVTRFANSHLQYALTWFALCAMVLGAGVYVGRHEYRLRQRA